jgi:hypothetical protein
MKWLYGILCSMVLVVSTDAATNPPAPAPTPVVAHVTFHSTFKAVPQNTNVVVPGLFIRYAGSYQIFLFDDPLKSGVVYEKEMYLPQSVQTIQPILAFEEKNITRHYWYCQPKLTLKDFQGKAFAIDVKQMPASISAKGDTIPTLTCTYKKIAMK